VLDGHGQSFEELKTAGSGARPDAGTEAAA
jgi:hypothetical protein